MTEKQKLLYWIKICDIHAKRLKSHFEKVEKLVPITAAKLSKFSEAQINNFDLVIFKFSKLQDDIGSKVFPIFLKTIEEDVESKTFIDILNKLEKIRVIENAEFWKSLKKVRNAIAHEYPDNPEIMAINLNDVLINTKIILKFWTKLKKEIAKHVK